MVGVVADGADRLGRGQCGRVLAGPPIRHPVDVAARLNDM